ncbi:hypothetical protein Tco_0632632 [Tanacetum coccineum]
MTTKDRITKYSTQQPIPTSTNDSIINPTPYNFVTNRSISPISWEFNDNNNGRWKRGAWQWVLYWVLEELWLILQVYGLLGYGNGWMRYEDGGESLENVVESGGGGDGSLKGCLDPWSVKPKSPKTPILNTAITKAGTKLLLHRAHFSCSWDTLGISTLKASAADT